MIRIDGNSSKWAPQAGPDRKPCSQLESEKKEEEKKVKHEAHGREADSKLKK